MTPIVILSSIAVAFLVFLILQVGWRYSRRSALGQAAHLTPVDLDAFENLTDPEEEEYLRGSLSPAEFRSVQRLRIRVAKMYVAALSNNASTLAAVGQSVRFHSNPEIAASGQELVQRAIRLKVGCLLSSVRLNAALAFPGHLSPSSAIASRYLAVKYIAAGLSGKTAA
ncbi:MAG: hypothetical protein WCC04_21660 [Terriglobales bacterium]